MADFSFSPIFDDVYERSLLFDFISHPLFFDSNKEPSGSLSLAGALSPESRDDIRLDPLPSYMTDSIEPPSWPTKRRRLRQLLRREIPDPLSEDEVLAIQDAFLANREEYPLREQEKAVDPLPVVRRMIYISSGNFYVLC